MAREGGKRAWSVAIGGSGWFGGEGLEREIRSQGLGWGVSGLRGRRGGDKGRGSAERERKVKR